MDNIEERYGRTFARPLYGAHRYHLPADDEEAERLEIGDLCWEATINPLCLRVHSGVILDLGTGNGAWVQEVAKMKPGCSVTGLDLYYLDLPETPNQANFEVDDCELQFAKREEGVTLINMRDSFLWVRNLQALLTEIHAILEPAGGFQSQEIRLTEWKSNKPNICRWRDQVLNCADKLGVQLHSALAMRQILAANGFVDYSEKRLIWTVENASKLHEFVELTVGACAGILYDALGHSDATTSIIDGAMEELKADDLSIEIGVDLCWARKCKGRPERGSRV